MHLRKVQIIVGLVGSLFFLVLALYHVPIHAVGASLQSADPVWIVAAMLVYAADLSLRAWRWQIILSSVAAVPYPAAARAILVGYGLNAIVPARLGELFRAEFVNQEVGLSRIWALTSIVMERLFDGLMVVACLAIGLFLAAATRRTAGVLIDMLVTGAALFGLTAVVVFCLAGPLMSRLCARLPRLSAQITVVQHGFILLRTWRTVEVAAVTLMIYLPDALALWFVVKAVGFGLGVPDTLVLLGAASLSTLVPSGPAFLGTLQFAYALAVEFAGAPRAVGVAAATLAQLCILLPIALAAVAVLIHRSGRACFAVFSKTEAKVTPAGP
jgi:glycosyltransferase 2 family protein